MPNKKVLAFSGSTRAGSVNKKLAAFAASKARDAGAEVTLVDLGDYVAPVYNQDDEIALGLPQSMKDFKALVSAHDALLIATPEYNGHVPPILINTFSWISRPEGDEPPSTAFMGKKVAIAAASPGGLGGVRVVPRLRDFMAELGAVTIPGFATVPGAFEAFDESGSLKSEAGADIVRDLAERLVAAA